jgi:thiol-disulfide isomerase/thioredoxin
MQKQLFSVCLFLIISFGLQAKDGYNIKVKFQDVTDSLVYLCHYFGKNQTVFKDDSMVLNKKGEGLFQSDQKIVGGIYMLLLSDRSAPMEILLRNGDQFSVDVKKSDVYNTAKFSGQSENEAFYEYQRFLVNYGSEYQKIEAKLANCKTKTDSNTIYKQLKVKGKELSDYRAAVIKKNPGGFMAALFNAVDEPEIPEELPMKADGTRDSSYPRVFYKSHYWDKYNFQDDRLIYSPIYERKLDNYLTRLVIPVPDSVQEESDKLLKKAEGTTETFKYTLWYLTRWTETSKIMGMDQAFVYLVENYYMKGKATWVDSAQLEKYIKRAKDIAPNMIGQPAMDLKMLDTSGTKQINLSSVQADYTILIFWSPDCGHCKKEIPQFDSLYKVALKKYNVKIYAVDADLETDKWKTFIREKNLGEGWIHVHDPNRQSNFRAFYDVYSTPTLYLLDDKKVIRGKRIDHNNVLGLIEWLEKKKKDKK